MAELPGGKDFLGLSKGKVLDRSGGSEDPEEAQQDQGDKWIFHCFGGYPHKICARVYVFYSLNVINSCHTS